MANHSSREERAKLEPRNLYPPCSKCKEFIVTKSRCAKGRKTPRVDGCQYYDDGQRKGWV